MFASFSSKLFQDSPPRFKARSLSRTLVLHGIEVSAMHMAWYAYIKRITVILLIH